MITIVLPVYNEELFLANVLESISTYPSITQILVVDGGSTDSTCTIVQEFKKNCTHLDIALLSNPDKLQGYALNLCLDLVSNQFLVRLDAHSHVPPFRPGGIDYFRDVKSLYDTGAYCSVGYRQRFAYKSILQCSLYILSLTPFLSRSKYRYALTPTSTWDTAWLFSTSVSRIRSIHGFKPSLTPNEDYDFNQRLIAATHLPLLIYPQLPLYYFPRSSLSSLFYQYFRYGYARALSFSSRSSVLSLWCISILQFLVFCLSTVLWSILSPPLFQAYLLLALILLSVACFAPVIDRLSYVPSGSFIRRYTYLVVGSLFAPFVLILPVISFVLGRLSFMFSLGATSPNLQ